MTAKRRSRDPRPASVRLAERLMVMPSGCIEWTGAVTEWGYGRFKFNGRSAFTHRAAWEMERGPIPDGLLVCHHCDNPRCCNVDHLFLGTNADNMRDMRNKDRSSKGRRVGDGSMYAHGERQHLAKLTADNVREIRRRLRSGERQKDIAAAFGVTREAITRINIMRNWKHVE